MKTRPVCLWQVRNKLNELNVHARAVRNEIDAVLLSDRVLRPESGKPPGTRTIMMLFKQLGPKGRAIAITHHYLYPDGAETPHDPKYVRAGSQRWMPAHTDSESCPDATACHLWQQKARQSLLAVERL